LQEITGGFFEPVFMAKKPMNALNDGILCIHPDIDCGGSGFLDSGIS
jgi:hypothetical protein